jgi:hypothetical protein
MKLLFASRKRQRRKFYIARLANRILWPPVPVSALIFLYLYFGAIGAPLAEPRWGWFEALTVQNDWSILKGKADVKITGGVFTAELYLEDGALAVTLKGRIHDGKVEAMAVRHSTDDEPRKLTGSLTRTRWKNGGGREAVLLTEAGQPWGVTVGLTREILNP